MTLQPIQLQANSIMKSSKQSIRKLSFSLLAILLLTLNACGGGGYGSAGGGSNETNGISFDSGTLSTDATYTRSFSKKGDYEYFCQIHAPNMQGKVVVSDVTAQDTVVVTIDNMAFKPASITIASGTIVKWVNNDNVSHTVTSDNPGNNSNGPGY